MNVAYLRRHPDFHPTQKAFSFAVALEYEDPFVINSILEKIKPSGGWELKPCYGGYAGSYPVIIIPGIQISEEDRTWITALGVTIVDLVHVSTLKEGLQAYVRDEFTRMHTGSPANDRHYYRTVGTGHPSAYHQPWVRKGYKLSDEIIVALGDHC